MSICEVVCFSRWALDMALLSSDWCKTFELWGLFYSGLWTFSRLNVELYPWCSTQTVQRRKLFCGQIRCGTLSCELLVMASLPVEDVHLQMKALVACMHAV